MALAALEDRKLTQESHSIRCSSMHQSLVAHEAVETPSSDLVGTDTALVDAVTRNIPNGCSPSKI